MKAFLPITWFFKTETEPTLRAELETYGPEKYLASGEICPCQIYKPNCFDEDERECRREVCWAGDWFSNIEHALWVRAHRKRARNEEARGRRLKDLMRFTFVLKMREEGIW